MIDNETIKQINELYSLGVSKTNIAKKLNISIPSVNKYIKTPAKKDNMIGQTFNNLTVLKIAEKNPKLKSRCIRYVCQCECGNIIEVNGNSLRTGHTTSCGCSRKNKNKIDLINKRFGKLTVLYDTQKRHDRHVIWYCQCDCGNYCEVQSKYLLNGNTQSCGCLKSHGEQFILSVLQEHSIIFQKEYVFPDLKNLKFDFAIMKNDIVVGVIEYNGEQHYKPIEFFGGEERYTLQKERDNKKIQFCKDNNIPLIIYRYDEELTKEKILHDLSRKMSICNGQS